MKKITRVAFYQGVYLGRDMIRSFAPDEAYSDGALHKGHVATLEDKGVLLTSPTAETLVPWNNVASVSFEREEAKPEPKIESKKSK